MQWTSLLKPGLAGLMVLAASACGEDETVSCSQQTGCQSSELESRQERRQDGLEVTACGSVVYDNLGGCDGQSAPQQCLIAAVEGCTPAWASFTRYTTEGDPIVELVLVGAGDDPCAITQLVDYSADEFRGDYGPRTEAVCSGLAIEEEGACIYMYADGCEIVDEW